MHALEHQFVCPQGGSSGDPMFEFHRCAREANESLLLAAKVLARAIASSLSAAAELPKHGREQVAVNDGVHGFGVGARGGCDARWQSVGAAALVEAARLEAARLADACAGTVSPTGAVAEEAEEWRQLAQEVVSAGYGAV